MVLGNESEVDVLRLTRQIMVLQPPKKTRVGQMRKRAVARKASTKYLIDLWGRWRRMLYDRYWLGSKWCVEDMVTEPGGEQRQRKESERGMKGERTSVLLPDLCSQRCDGCQTS